MDFSKSAPEPANPVPCCTRQHYYDKVCYCSHPSKDDDVAWQKLIVRNWINHVCSTMRSNSQVMDICTWLDDFLIALHRYHPATDSRTNVS